MASVSRLSENPTGTTVAPIPSSFINGNKASIAPPTVTANGNMELGQMGPVEDKLPLHEDIMQLARLGEIKPVKKLLEGGDFDAKYKDRQGITPLHVSTRRSS